MFFISVWVVVWLLSSRFLVDLFVIMCLSELLKFSVSLFIVWFCMV